MNAPVFIVGANRSGTTLLRLILNAHSEMAIPDEISYFYSFWGEAGYPRWRNPRLTTDQYVTFVDDFLETNQASTPGLEREPLREKILAGPHDLRRPYQLLLETWAESQGKSRWGEKTPGNLFYAHHILSMFPDALFIHLVRDPRAVVHSMQGVSFFTNDVILNALNLQKSLADGRNHLEREVPISQRMTVRYEDLVHDPSPTVRRICSFAGLEYEPEMLSFHENAAEYMTTAASTSFNTKATQPISSARTDAWTSELSAEETSLIEYINQVPMKQYGYDPYGASLPIRKWIELAIKYLYWQYHQWRNRHIPQYFVRHSMFEGLHHRTRRNMRYLRRRMATLLQS